MGVDFVQLAMILSALFCVVWSLRICVLYSVGAQAGLAFVCTDLMYCL